MLNPFPDLLVLSFFAPALIRAGAGVMFLYIAYAHAKRRDEIEKISFPLIGASRRVVALSCALHVFVGGMLIFGYHTQVAAILGLIVFAKSLIIKNRYPALVPLERPALFLLIVMCLSLLLTGAGALAYDLPL